MVKHAIVIVAATLVASSVLAADTYKPHYPTTETVRLQSMWYWYESSCKEERYQKRQFRVWCSLREDVEEDLEHRGVCVIKGEQNKTEFVECLKPSHQ